MRTRTLPAATALAVLFSSVALITGAAGSAAADSSKLLPVKSVGDVLVDGVHQHVFISDPTSGKIVVTDYAGTVVTTLAGLPGVTGLELSADSGQVYAAVADQDAIVSVNTEKPTETRSYALPGADNPRHLARTGSTLWFGYQADYSGHIGSLDLSGDEPVVTLAQDDGQSWYYSPLLASAPGAPDVLAVGEPGMSPATLAVYSVADGKTTLRKASWNPSDSENLSDLALTPDGGQLVTASGSPYYHPVFSTTDLSKVGQYTTTSYPNAVAIAPNGTVAAGTDSSYEPDVHIFSPGAGKPVREYDFPNTGTSSGSDLLVKGGLAWAPDSSRLFAVSENSANAFSLRVLAEPGKSAPKVTVTAPSKATRAKSLTVKGTVTATVPLPSGTPVTVTRTDVDSPGGKSLGTKKLGAGGAFSFADTPPAGGKVTYKVSYAGDATHTAASGSASVAVSRATPTLTLNRNGKLYAYNTKVSFTAHLGSTYKNRTVQLWSDPFGADKPKKLVKTGKVNAKGDLSVTVAMTRDTAVSAVFTGDARYASKTVKSTAYAQVKISTSVSRQYRTARIGSTSYAYFHKKTNPLFTTTMTAYKNRAQKLTLEVYAQGKWRSGGSQYFKLASDGKSAVQLAGTHTTGYKMRMRSSYVNSSSGDTVNSTTNGAWKYFYFTN
ncbi:Ig-like domain repeat protein [Streptomyces sp. A 4/2]|uniref:Ig-like domain repeat protein n=1 Tax=Streptomyces sp. A 4/2 TaxID=2934314 RepID=UPI0020243FEE|nr:Ig-like domain repeat protein [Streptomyces sp. A 4/2]